MEMQEEETQEGLMRHARSFYTSHEERAGRRSRDIVTRPTRFRTRRLISVDVTMTALASSRTIKKEADKNEQQGKDKAKERRRAVRS